MNLSIYQVQLETSVCLIYTAKMDYTATISPAKLKRTKENNARKTQTAKMDSIALIQYALTQLHSQV